MIVFVQEMDYGHSDSECICLYVFLTMISLLIVAVCEYCKELVFRSGTDSLSRLLLGWLYST